MNINFKNGKCDKRVIADEELAKKYKLNVGDCINFWCIHKCDREGNCDNCISCHCGNCKFYNGPQ